MHYDIIREHSTAISDKKVLEAVVTLVAAVLVHLSHFVGTSNIVVRKQSSHSVSELGWVSEIVHVLP